jgi:hypothetical protein
VIALGALLIATGFVLLIPPGMFPGSAAHRNVEMGSQLWRTPGYQKDRDETRRGKLVGVLIGLGLIAVGSVCIMIGS